MTPAEYSALALRTAAPDEIAYERIQHGVIGVGTEAGELLDQLKRHMFYGQPLDLTNLVEECGDVLWYLNLILTACWSSFEQAMEKNIAKLAKRYPGGYSDYHAVNRDLEQERKALEDE